MIVKHGPPNKHGTAQDKMDMWRVGRDQELNRNFRFLSVLGFSTALFGSSNGLANGGKGGMIYSYLGGLIGFSFVILSMVEMASIYHPSEAPTSGGQYHWVSEFVPRSSNMLMGVIAINYPDSYTYKPWHVTLLLIAVAVVALAFTTFLAQKLPLIEGVILTVHCFGFFGIPIPLWVLSPSVPPSEVFGSIEDRGGWDNNGLSCLHQDVSRVLPRGMIWTLILNGAMGFVMNTGFPFIQVFLNSTGSVKAATGVTVVIMVMQFCAAISNVATTSRQVYALARDQGLPFPGILCQMTTSCYLYSNLSQISPTFTVPPNALFLSLIIVSLLSLIEHI
ncbi:hypothetical protein BDV38DRAFT_294169 [Aspergillus pseudotamarii]|uniref:Amino acid permease-domain-containing protein n=1 Tax=Aspergillus pseudotamarii TaxID=132259 RepID=A0A5N6SRY5_ASPPS|nr:uncharacterized protein BDV38DRAFT_294169 [Aspergillus pseudotamarii]KAE8135914.1 hypothetical protein BDV38DRAFT_294169 [Aspergillus pseudotamarii]